MRKGWSSSGAAFTELDLFSEGKQSTNCIISPKMLCPKHQGYVLTDLLEITSAIVHDIPRKPRKLLEDESLPEPIYSEV